MALATSVTGDGRLIDSLYIGTGKDRYTRTEVVDGDEVVNRHVIAYTESRETRKWYSVTESAATTYLAANPTKNVRITCTNEVIGAYDVTAETLVRTETEHTVSVIEEG
jgi:hypothetical protein